MPTKIEWVKNPDGAKGETWNPMHGCTPVSPGCAHCHAARMAKRLRGRYGYPSDDSFGVTLRQERLGQPLAWKKPRMCFVCSMGDLFHKDVPFDFIAAVFGVMAACPRHVFQLLTKRPGRMLEWFKWVEEMSFRRLHGIDGTNAYFAIISNLALSMRHAGMGPPRMLASTWPLPNVWLGVSIENPDAYDRIRALMKIPTVVRFLSVEPMLGPVDLDIVPIEINGVHGAANVLSGEWWPTWQSGEPMISVPNADISRVDWVICGAETGPGKRHMDPDWARSLRDQCLEAGVPFFFKRDSLGNRELDSVLWEQMPGISNAAL